ncbi:hypothetical protein [Lentzea flaviverrucosa]|uniref:Uncharacterized protein n=1 Tax=Lentzea flaviverrucosa TaxID=200379 RepID=A0A1H9SIL4_9PSEU|nr:hypothetical protein [Lentzea flaviverrucosa]RDI25385.1 hypothetical protein DFR72_10877 [Lentzea flaviverrucosa]SER84728.1 hypothetical protein SAMN05216195_10778 [Lentzea flaviverrucosa]
MDEDLRRRADDGDPDAIGQLVELVGEAGDMAELRRLAEAGGADAVDVLVELAGEREDLAELRRLADLGNTDAAEVLDRAARLALVVIQRRLAGDQPLRHDDAVHRKYEAQICEPYVPSCCQGGALCTQR